MTFLTFHEFKIHSENHEKSPEKDKPTKSVEINEKGEEIVTLEEIPSNRAEIPPPVVSENLQKSPKNSKKLGFDCQFCAQNFDSIANLQMHFRKDHQQMITIFEEQKKKLQKNSTEIQIVGQPKPNQLMSHSELKCQKKPIFKSTKSNFLTFSKVYKHIFCCLKIGKKSIFAPKKGLKL